MKILAIRGRNLASLEGDFEIDFTVEPLLFSRDLCYFRAYGSR